MLALQIVGLIDMDVSGPDFSEMYARHLLLESFYLINQLGHRSATFSWNPWKVRHPLIDTSILLIPGTSGSVPDHTQRTNINECSQSVLHVPITPRLEVYSLGRCHTPRPKAWKS